MARVSAGVLLLAIGVVHNVVGVLVGWPWLLEILADGYVAAVPDDAPWRMAIFWFLWFGWALMLVGAAWARIERSGDTIPGWQGTGLALLVLAGGLAMPISGFWLGLPVAGLVWWRSARPAAPAAPGSRAAR